MRAAAHQPLRARALRPRLLDPVKIRSTQTANGVGGSRCQTLASKLALYLANWSFEMVCSKLKTNTSDPVNSTGSGSTWYKRNFINTSRSICVTEFAGVFTHLFEISFSILNSHRFWTAVVAGGTLNRFCCSLSHLQTVLDVRPDATCSRPSKTLVPRSAPRRISPLSRRRSTVLRDDVMLVWIESRCV